MASAINTICRGEAGEDPSDGTTATAAAAAAHGGMASSFRSASVADAVGGAAGRSRVMDAVDVGSGWLSVVVVVVVMDGKA